MSPNRPKQTLKPLPSDLRSVVRSGITINTVAQCVEELVYNSIDAKAKNIRIGVNLETFNVRVDDDGFGVTEVDLEVVGIRYTTSKCSNLADLNSLSSYGFRGEALASIVEISNTVDIITRPKATPGIELKKKFENGATKGYIEKYNTSIKTSGTTVIVGKLLSKLPVRQKRIDKSIQLEDIKKSLEKIVLINPDLSVELRNEKNGTVLFSFKPSSCYSDAINQLFMSSIGFEVKFVQENFLHKKFFFSLSVSNDFIKSKHFQFVFLNSRFIRRCKIHKWVGNFILNRNNDISAPKSDKYPIFMLNITCPLGEYDITLEPKKQTVEFKDWDAIYSGIDGLILKLKHKNSLSFCENITDVINKNVSLISSYDVKGALHSRVVAREAAGSCRSESLDSNDKSYGKSGSPMLNMKPITRNQNLIRSGHSTHVVNVREIRKKRKLEKLTAKKVSPVPFKPRHSPTDNKPKLTLETFKKFPVWAEALEESTSTTLPPKRYKVSNNQENYKYYVPDIHSFEKCDLAKEEKEKLGADSSSANLKWKMNRYFQNYQQEECIKDTTAVSEAEGKDMCTAVYGQLDGSKVIEEPVACPKSPLRSSDDVQDYICSNSAEFVRNHLNNKWSLKHLKEDIIDRLFKYYKDCISSRSKSSQTKKTETNIFRDVNEEIPSTISNSLVDGCVMFSKPSPTKCITRPPLSNPLSLEDSSKSIPQLLSTCTKPSLKSPDNGAEVSLVASDNNQQVFKWPSTSFLTGKPAADTASATISEAPKPSTEIFSVFNSQRQHKDVAVATEGICLETNQTSSNQVPNINLVDNSKTTASYYFKDSKQISLTQQFSALKPSSLEFVKFNKGMSENDAAVIPPLLNLFPVQKSFSTDWSDSMITSDNMEVDKDLFPSEWVVEIVMDCEGQEWLQTLDNSGRFLYINLASGVSSYNIAQLDGSLRKVTVEEMKKFNPIRYNWLRKYFPRGFKQFWNGNSREVNKEGDLTKLNNSVLGESLFKCISTQQISNDKLSKWTDNELENISKYFSDGKDSGIKTINNVCASGIQCWKSLGSITSSFRFSREDFEMIRVIGQYDKKFILAGIKRSSNESETLVIFDQHAVHERIRLERLITESFVNPKIAIKYLKAADVIPPYSLCLSETEVRIMQSYTECFRQAALKFEAVSSTIVKIKSVPKCFMEKCTNEPPASREETFRNLVHSLIQELIHTIMETKIASLTGLPRTVNSVLCSQACHGAIKFGDELDLESCKELILNLRKCKNLFQCAHGRPSVVPLMKGQDMLMVSNASNKFVQACQTDRLVTTSCFPPHDECSNYFCSTKDTASAATPSNYFSSTENTSVASRNITTEKNQKSPFRLAGIATGENIANATTETSDFFSFMQSEKPSSPLNLFSVTAEESPYFRLSQSILM